MRLSILPVLLAGVGVVSQVSAEPIRVVVETTSNTNANIRFGHALANANVNGNDDNVARIMRPTVIMTTSAEVKSNGIGRHFCGASLREKALHLSNAFRHAMGLPLIEADPHHSALVGKPGENDDGVHILPMPFTQPAPGENVKETLTDGSVVRIYHNQPLEENGKHHEHNHHGDHDRHDHHSHHPHRKHHKGGFLRRIHKAIMALGPWEGRAVAFVLGCGIGVLLRMFWVLTVLAYRTVRGDREEETFDHEYIMYEPETLFVAPPEYTDEKVKVAELEGHHATEARE
ncbi:hypothetical protein BS17DRAFT_806340 [Gyrodon lividus]|nr:hypothetical protein BS17DRAFT_806340 [Gyrodon lividus]